MLRLLLVISLLTGCTSRTDLGPCVGVLDTKDPALVYELSVENVVLGALLSETLIVPAFIILKDLECPVERKDK